MFGHQSLVDLCRVFIFWLLATSRKKFWSILTLPVSGGSCNLLRPPHCVDFRLPVGSERVLQAFGAWGCMLTLWTSPNVFLFCDSGSFVWFFHFQKLEIWSEALSTIWNLGLAQRETAYLHTNVWVERKLFSNARHPKQLTCHCFCFQFDGNQVNLWPTYRSTLGFVLRSTPMICHTVWFLAMDQSASVLIALLTEGPQAKSRPWQLPFRLTALFACL